MSFLTIVCLVSCFAGSSGTRKTIAEREPDVSITLGVAPEHPGGPLFQVGAGEDVPGNGTLAKQPPASSHDSCLPQCSWSCEQQPCNEVCEPVCEAPRCQLRCPRPDVTGCNVSCGEPNCRTICPPAGRKCAKDNCPTCETKCHVGPELCRMDCHKNLNCVSECEHPKCIFHCRAPNACPKPVCKMVCEALKNPCPTCTFHEQLPVKMEDGSVVVWKGNASNVTTTDARGRPSKTDVFNDHVGDETIPGAPVDKDGNVVGDSGDLVRDGAFIGQLAVIVDVCSETNPRGKFIDALRQKGFNVTRYGLSELPSATDLDHILEKATEFWLVSGKELHLNSKHLDVLLKHWQSGLGMYIMGDNDPWFKDANQLLAKMSLPRMSGDEKGGTLAHRRESAGKIGFVSHALTTGIKSLYEGSTVATFSDTAIQSAGMVDILREHSSGSISVAYRAAQDGHGPVVADGAFTRLYEKYWDKAGSPRFVKNIAAMLAVH